MASNYEFKKQLLDRPGKIIVKTIEAMSMSIDELAYRLRKNKKEVFQILKGDIPITTSTAIALQKALGISADFWIKSDKQYQKELAKIKLKITLDR